MTTDNPLELILHEEYYHFRQMTEVTSEAKGGYLSFSLRISKSVGGYFEVVLDFVPATEDHDNVFKIHPSIFYMKAEKSTKKKNSVPLKPFCQFVLVKRGETLWAKNEVSSELEVNVSSALIECPKYWLIMFGHDDSQNPNPQNKDHVKKGIKLNIIRASQKGTGKQKKKNELMVCDSSDGTSLESVLLKRLQLAVPGMDEALIHEYFNGLRKTFYYSNRDQRVAVHMAKVRATLNNHLSIISPMIKNMDEPLTAPLKLEKCKPQEGCVRGYHSVYIHLGKEINGPELELVITHQGHELLTCKVSVQGKSKIVAVCLKPPVAIPSDWNNVDIKCELFLRRKLTDTESNRLPFQFHQHQETKCVCEFMKDDSLSTEKESSPKNKKRKNNISNNSYDGKKYRSNGCIETSPPIPFLTDEVLESPSSSQQPSPEGKGAFQEVITEVKLHDANDNSENESSLKVLDDINSPFNPDQKLELEQFMDVLQFPSSPLMEFKNIETECRPSWTFETEGRPSWTDDDVVPEMAEDWTFSDVVPQMGIPSEDRPRGSDVAAQESDAINKDESPIQVQSHGEHGGQTTALNLVFGFFVILILDLLVSPILEQW